MLSLDFRQIKNLEVFCWVEMRTTCSSPKGRPTKLRDTLRRCFLEHPLKQKGSSLRPGTSKRSQGDKKHYYPSLSTHTRDAILVYCCVSFTVFLLHREPRLLGYNTWMMPTKVPWTARWLGAPLCRKILRKGCITKSALWPLHSPDWWESQRLDSPNHKVIASPSNMLSLYEIGNFKLEYSIILFST